MQTHSNFFLFVGLLLVLYTLMKSEFINWTVW